MKIDFQNTEVAFHANTNRDLKQAHLLFQFLKFPLLVKISQKLTLFSLKIRLPIKGIIKSTIFRQFCGGETIKGCQGQIDRLAIENVGSILDYSAEGKETEEAFDYTMNTTIETIKFAENNKDVPFSVFKPSGIGSHPIYKVVSSGKELTEAEKEEWNRVRDRYYKIADAAFKAQIPVMVDAEEVYMQPAIDALVEELMLKYNKEKAIVWNTTQMYRWDRLDFIKKSVAHARENKYFYGLKTVRGAYMEKERARAKEQGYKDPIQPNKESTDRDFDAATEFLIENSDICSVMVATHNAKSSEFMTDVMDKYNLPHNDQRVYLAQLFGMSDDLSMNVAKAGYNVVKYLPFGPVEDVMPYLFRRAEENTSVKGQTSRELALIKKELQRRKGAKA